MAGVPRRSSFGSSVPPPSSSSLVKRPAAENAGKVTQASQQQAKKRVALRNLTNQSNVGSNSSRSSFPKKGSFPTRQAKIGPNASLQRVPLVPSALTKSTARSNAPPISGTLAPCTNSSSPSRSIGCSSTCDSMKSPEIEYLDKVEPASEGRQWKKDVILGMEKLDVVDVDNNYNDPQFCASLACDIYNHLRLAETKKRPSTDFMETLQKDINPSMRAILVDWLVEVSEEYRLVPDTLYLAVNFIDRYLSGNEMNRQQLQLLGVACMLIAAKYEEICAPQVEEFCFITDNTYVREEVLEMEATVLRFLKFEMTAPTVKCFLRRFVRVAQHSEEVQPLHLEFLANYVAEMSLLEYSFLEYPPSLVAASAIFLAKFVLLPAKRPWNATLEHYTQYRPSDLCACVKDLHRVYCNSGSSGLPAIREKYSQHKYKFVAKKFCPASIPADYLQDLTL